MLLFLIISLEKFESTLSRINRMFLTYFIKFHKFISNTTSYEIINFKSDNGTEYINKTFN